MGGGSGGTDVEREGAGLELTHLILRHFRNGPLSGIDSDRLQLEGFTAEEIGHETKTLIDEGYLKGVDVRVSGSHPAYLATTLTVKGREHLRELEQRLHPATAAPKALSAMGYYRLVLTATLSSALEWARAHVIVSVLAAAAPVASAYLARGTPLPAEIAGFRGVLYGYGVLTAVALIAFAVRTPVKLYREQVEITLDLRRKLEELSKSANSFDRHVMETTAEFLRRYGDRGKELLRYLITNGQTDYMELKPRMLTAGFTEDEFANAVEYGMKAGVLRYASPTRDIPKNLWSINPDVAAYAKRIVFQKRA